VISEIRPSLHPREKYPAFSSKRAIATNRLAGVIIDFPRLSAALRQFQPGTQPESCASGARRLSSHQ